MFKSKYFTYLSLIIIFALIFYPCLSYGQEDLDTAIQKLSDKITQHMAEKKKTKIAVIPFQDLRTDMVTTLGKYIAEELTTSLFNSGKFNIIERNLLNKVLEELKLSQTGAVDPSSAKELGKITGVDAVVTGTIQDLVNRVAVNCRLIETETGNIFAAASEKIMKNESISKLMGEVIEGDLKTEEKKVKEEKEIGGPKTYDASGYLLKDIKGFYFSFRSYYYPHKLFTLEFISITVHDSLEINVFFSNPSRSDGWVGFEFPKLIDDQGNSYLSSKIRGDIKQANALPSKDKCFAVYLPAEGRIPLVFEFPLIPTTVNKLWLNINNKSIEIDWQELLKKTLK